MFGRADTNSSDRSAWLVCEEHVYSLAPDFAYAHRPWLSHRIVQVTSSRCLVDWQGQTRSLDRSKLARDGWAFAAGVCFYAETLMRRITAEWTTLEAAIQNDRVVPSYEEADLLGLGPSFTRADVMSSFRRRAFELHPDRGGDPKTFGRLIEARTRALARARS